jgi:hypothetical protein
VREMSISENYEGEITPIRSNISSFSRGTDSNLGASSLRTEEKSKLRCGTTIT